MPNIIQSGFKSTRIFPFNRNSFSDACFAPAKTTDRLLLSEDFLDAGSVSHEGEVNVSMPCVFTINVLTESDSVTYVSLS